MLRLITMWRCFPLGGWFVTIAYIRNIFMGVFGVMGDKCLGL